MIRSRDSWPIAWHKGHALHHQGCPLPRPVRTRRFLEEVADLWEKITDKMRLCQCLPACAQNKTRNEQCRHTKSTTSPLPNAILCQHYYMKPSNSQITRRDFIGNFFTPARAEGATLIGACASGVLIYLLLIHPHTASVIHL
jgi:hypothetical protein